jgi:hypothetical protein
VGDSFGQDCLRTPGNRRKLTVMARTDMVLLHVDKQDYLNIFVPEQLGDGVSKCGREEKGTMNFCCVPKDTQAHYFVMIK